MLKKLPRNIYYSHCSAFFVSLVVAGYIKLGESVGTTPDHCTIACTDGSLSLTFLFESMLFKHDIIDSFSSGGYLKNFLQLELVLHYNDS